LALLADSGVPTAVLCFTHGESSTLHRPGDLHTVRADELACAARELGVERLELTLQVSGSVHMNDPPGAPRLILVAVRRKHAVRPCP
ncbi:hypothetical protein, partial [Streptomyces shenzhenensis]|uniref:hypothetical protein n=1 Tax=Streptomyces shenzhenensis TaxID=943815 RepID=UPI001F2694A8